MPSKHARSCQRLVENRLAAVISLMIVGYTVCFISPDRATPQAQPMIQHAAAVEPPLRHAPPIPANRGFRSIWTMATSNHLPPDAMFRVPPSEPGRVTGLSPNTETARYKLSRPPKPEIGIIEKDPVLKSLAIQHSVRIPSAGGKVQRLACVQLALSPFAASKMRSHAFVNGETFSHLPSTAMEATEPSSSLVPHGIDLVLNDKNEMAGEQRWVSRERMHFPGTKTEMHARVSEMYVVRDRGMENKSAVRNFFTNVVEFAGRKSAEYGGVKLKSPEHVATVASFELGDYLLHRQLDKRPGTLDRIKKKFALQGSAPSGANSKRKLLFEGHGTEQMFAGEFNSEAPLDFSLPDGVAISHGAPSGKTMYTLGKTMPDIAAVKAQWPSYCTQSMAGTTHQIEFSGKDVAPSGPFTGYGRVNGADLFRMATGLDPATGHGRVKNQLLSPLEDLRDESPIKRRKARAWNNAFQRGTVTQDGFSFAAMNAENAQPVDILTVKPGHEGDLKDVITQLKDKGILDQYDEIHVQVCRNDSRFSSMVANQPRRRVNFDPHTGYSREWDAAKQNLPRNDMPTVVEFDKADERPKVTSAHPVHENQLRPDSPRPSPALPRKLSEVSI